MLLVTWLVLVVLQGAGSWIQGAGFRDPYGIFQLEIMLQSQIVHSQETAEIGLPAAPWFSLLHISKLRRLPRKILPWTPCLTLWLGWRRSVTSRHFVCPSLLTVWLRAFFAVHCWRETKLLFHRVSCGVQLCNTWTLHKHQINSIFTLFQQAKGLVLSCLKNREQKQCNLGLTEILDATCRWC